MQRDVALRQLGVHRDVGRRPGVGVPVRSRPVAGRLPSPAASCWARTCCRGGSMVTAGRPRARRTPRATTAWSASSDGVMPRAATSTMPSSTPCSSRLATAVRRPRSPRTTTLSGGAPRNVRSRSCQGVVVEGREVGGQQPEVDDRHGAEQGARRGADRPLPVVTLGDEDLRQSQRPPGELGQQVGDRTRVATGDSPELVR